MAKIKKRKKTPTIERKHMGFVFKVNAKTGKPLGRPPIGDADKLVAWQSLNDKAVAAEENDEAPELYPEEMNKPNHADQRSDAEVLAIVQERFKYMAEFATLLCEGGLPSLIVSGAPGVGKTFSLNRIVNKYETKEGVKAERINGVVTPINLYQTFWNFKDKNCVIIIDDSDGVFKDIDSINILKAALDSSETRRISWRSESKVLSDNEIPKSFEFEAQVIFITNMDFQAIIDGGKGPLVPHLKAFMSRSVYLDVMLHRLREVSLWVEYQINKTHMLNKQLGLTLDQEAEVVEFMMANRDKLRLFDFRTARSIARSVMMPGDWKKRAAATVFRSEE